MLVVGAVDDQHAVEVVELVLGDARAVALELVPHVLTLRILAFLLFSQPAGVMADRVSRKRVLVAADLTRLALMGLFPFVTAVWQVTP